MFSHQLQGTPDKPVLKLTGDLTLEHCRELQAVLIDETLPAQLILDMGESTSSDLSCIQILQALLRTPGREVRFMPLPDHLTELAAAVGATRLINELRTCTEDNT